MIDLDEDPYYAGSPWADFETGLQLIASYKKFSVNMQWYAVVGDKLYNRPRYNADRIDQNNYFRSGATFYTAQTPGNEWPRAAVGAPDRGIQYNVLPQSDRWLEDGIYICTGYISRGNGSTFEGSMPPAKKHKVAVYNWGLVDEKSQTIYPWDSWQIKYTYEPALWFHDIFRKDGSAYKQTEVDFIRTITEKNRE